MGIPYTYTPDTFMTHFLDMGELAHLRRRAQAAYRDQSQVSLALHNIITQLASWEIETAMSYGQLPDAHEILQEVGKVLLPDKPVGETTKAANKAKKAAA